MDKYFPFGFESQLVAATMEEERNVLTSIRDRMDWLNKSLVYSGLPGHIFAAAIAKLCGMCGSTTNALQQIQGAITPQELGEIANSLAPLVADTPPRLEFPNAIALVDCRFVENEEWEYLRHYSIGGSDAAAVLGVSHYNAMRGLYWDKVTYSKKPNDVAKQFIFDYGHNVESFVIQKACDLLGAKRVPEYRMFRHKDYPWITANPDAILQFPDGHLALFEAKTATRWKKDDWAVVPEYYVSQPQQYLGVLDDPRLTTAYIACVFGPLPMDWKLHFIDRDYAFWENLRDRENDFWLSYVAPQVLPPLSGDPDLDRAAMYGTTFTPTEAVAEIPKQYLPLLKEYMESKSIRLKKDANVRQLMEEEKRLLQEIKSYCDEGINICRRDGHATYRIKVADRVSETVNTDMLPNDVKIRLLGMMETKAKASIPFAFPTIK